MSVCAVRRCGTRLLRALACLLAIALGCASARAQAIGFLGDRDLAPYEFLVNGVPRGANVELAQAIGTALGRPVQVQLVDWGDAQARVVAGQGDVLTFLTPTPERERVYDFTTPTFPVAFALFVRSDHRDAVAEAVQKGSLAGLRIGVTHAGLARALLENNHPEAEFVVVENLLEGTRRLVNGDFVALGAQVWSENFLLSELGIRGVTHLPPFEQRHGAMAVRKGNQALLDELNGALAGLRSSGELDKIVDRWTTTRLRLVSEETLVALAVMGGVGAATVLLLVAGLIWSGRQKARLKREVQERMRVEEALRRSEADLQTADRSKDRFIATLAHELRNPLAPIANATQLLQLKGGDSREGRKALGVIQRQLSHLTRLVDDLLDVGRITSGKLELRREPVRLADVIGDAIEASRPLIETCGHRLDIASVPSGTRVNVDRTRLAQVVMNLLTNAAKYTPAGGVIRLAVAVHDDEVQITVEDNGRGIAPQALDAIFEMFRQERESLPQAGGGLGIGLWVTRQLVEMHGGTVDAHSAGEGQGAQFVVTLPHALLPQDTGDAAGAGSRDAAAPVGACRVLVVDDNVDSAESISLLLAAFGHEVKTAFDGHQALTLGEQFRPELVLLDLGMPQLSGYEVCRRLRSLPWGRGIVVAAMTGWGGPTERAATREAGFDHHLVKPLDPDGLIALLREVHDARAHEPYASVADARAADRHPTAT